VPPKRNPMGSHISILSMITRRLGRIFVEHCWFIFVVFNLRRRRRKRRNQRNKGKTYMLFKRRSQIRI